MGRLIYHRINTFELDDRLLSQLEAVIEAKLRRGESFMFVIPTEANDGSGRVAIWVNKASNLVYKYRHERPRVDPAWYSALMLTANSPSGLVIVGEPPTAVAEGA